MNTQLMPDYREWPPKPYDQAMNAIGEAHEWWEGDVSKLSGRYGYRLPQNHPNQFRGGVVGAVARMWLGKPVGAGESADKLHVPLPADIVALSGNTLFHEPPVIGLSAGEENEAGQARIDALMNTQRVAADLLVAAEMCAAHGGVFGRVVWDTSVQAEPWIEWVPAYSAIPQWRYGRLVGVTFVNVLEAGKDVWRHLQYYGAGFVEHHLFKGSDTELGDEKDLGIRPETAPLETVVDVNNRIGTGGTMLAAVYIPNAQPNVAFLKHGELKHLGRPDLSPDLFPLFDKIDMAYSSLMRDVRLARARIIADESLLEQRGHGRGMAFDVDREVYSSVAGDPDKPLLQEVQFAIRIDEHLKTIDDLTVRTVRRAGYSPLSIGLQVDGTAQTATEIKALTRRTADTQRAKGRYWSAALSHLTEALVEIDAAMNRTMVGFVHKPTVEIAPLVEETELDRAQTIQALDAAQAVSTDTKVRMLHPEWEETRVKLEVEGILAEKGVQFDPFNVDADMPVI